MQDLNKFSTADFYIAQGMSSAVFNGRGCFRKSERIQRRDGETQVKRISIYEDIGFKQHVYTYTRIYLNIVISKSSVIFQILHVNN